MGMSDNFDLNTRGLVSEGWTFVGEILGDTCSWPFWPVSIELAATVIMVFECTCFCQVFVSKVEAAREIESGRSG